MSCSLQEQGSMETVRILVLAGMRPRLQRRLYEARTASCARVDDVSWPPSGCPPSPCPLAGS